MLKKICRCGKIIPQTKFICNECEVKSGYRKREGYKDYKSKRTDTKEQRFYNNNKDWTITRQAVINRDNGICLLCEENNKHNYVDEVHHIVELKEDWSRRYDMNNLISLCKRCHFCVHKKYRQDSKSKKEMQEKLKDLIKREL